MRSFKPFREGLILTAIVALSFLCAKIGYVSFDLPFKKINHSITPKYSLAAMDPSMVLFENDIVFLFKKTPTNTEVINAYTGRDKSLIQKMLYPAQTYKDFWAFHFNPTFGFLGIEFDKFGPWLLALAYPFYWIVRLIFAVIALIS